MSRLTITFSDNNDAWLNAQVENNEYSSKSEAVNDLIRKARREQEQVELIRAKLIKAEQSGFTDRSPGDRRPGDRTPEQIREEVREGLRADGIL